jgi:hypothetical protein
MLRLVDVEICGARSIGALMRLSFNHVEALQILDLPNLIQHCAQCFATSLASDSVAAPFECEKMQDSLAVQVSYMFIFSHVRDWFKCWPLAVELLAL